MTGLLQAGQIEHDAIGVDAGHAIRDHDLNPGAQGKWARGCQYERDADRPVNQSPGRRRAALARIIHERASRGSSGGRGDGS